ncbi:glycosyltransferase [Ancylothrix sp. C2]|uniref:glycosyltransferase n=1 Tax=Ancylothrix sp. D3o TaxID=2953691 RepID=UPI0021BAFE1D|nr:glycosyltransferase [Ancylothrix sp. D3o]MCT7950020.1 glycosyltransferase [Ancylothrix sp. D3o]
MIALDIIVFTSRWLGWYSSLKSFAQKLKIIPSDTSLLKVTANDLIKPEILTSPPGSSTTPIIFVSACIDKNLSGGWRYSGGIKELNYLVKLLRNRGYEAYMVTYDGSYEPWLVEHQPHISLEKFRQMLNLAQDVRCVTSVPIAKAFINECKQIYLWDMELSETDKVQFYTLAGLYRKKIKRVAGISRTIQAWHMAHFEKPCSVIPNLLDESLWYPDEAKRRPRHVGYMNEGSHTDEYINIIKQVFHSVGLDLKLELIKGCEAEVLSGMQSCEVFLSLNIGKDFLWGEGCPRTTIEALSTGCVVIAFDIIGNRETLLHNFNGVIVSRYRPDLMAEALISLYKDPNQIERMRNNALSMIKFCHNFESRWPLVKDFLELEEAAHKLSIYESEPIPKTIV